MISVNVPQYQRVILSLPLFDSAGKPISAQQSYPTIMFLPTFSFSPTSLLADDVFSWTPDSTMGDVYRLFVIPKRQNAQIIVRLEAYVPGSGGAKLLQVSDTVMINVLQNGLAQPLAKAVIG